ncbi:MAG: type II toxin-antitoxin system prevent-host-death family antitoxin [Acidobacteria bacterium]|nr:type II toxin-antitoxin system prevent-host-death family antitoxin [Acidobacteriota bacterium]
MKSATVRDLRTKTSEVLRAAARHSVVITSRGRPVACVVGVQEDGRASTAPRKEGALSQREKDRMFKLAARIWKIKPERGKKWISQQYHDRVLYGDRDQ